MDSGSELTATPSTSTTGVTLEDCFLPSMYYTAILCAILGFVTLARHFCRIDSLFMIYSMRVWSKLNGILIELYLPVCIRESIYGAYSKFAEVRSFEMEKDFKEYNTFQDFFSRHLRPGARVVDPLATKNPSSLTSPCDGTVKSCGEIGDDGQVGFIKGQKFSLEQLITGSTTSKHQKSYQHTLLEEFSAKKNQCSDEKATSGSGKLGYCVIYLGLGDYHRFHSPADILFTSRRHIAGACFPVKDSFCESHPGVLNRNERVVMEGEWEGRYFSYTPVGAFNVGSIKVGFDRDLSTNQLLHTAFSSTEEKEYDIDSCKEKMNASADSEVKPSMEASKVPYVKRLEEIGYFAFGSTIVMVFELPEKYEWRVTAGQKVQLGQMMMEVQTDDDLRNQLYLNPSFFSLNGYFERVVKNNSNFRRRNRGGEHK